MIVLNSNHLRVLRQGGDSAERLKAKLPADGREVVTTIINAHEGLRGYLAEINTAKTAHAKVRFFGYLQDLIEYFADWRLLPFDDCAAAEYDRLRKLCKAKNSTADLQIAAITICHNALLLSADRDFDTIVQHSSLRVADWLFEEILTEESEP